MTMARTAPAATLAATRDADVPDEALLALYANGDPGAARLLSQRLVIPELLGLDAANHTLGLHDQIIELLIRTNVQMAEPLEELMQIFDG